MRISFRGYYSAEAVLGQIQNVLEILAGNGVSEYRHVNLYVTLYNDGKLIDLLDEDGGVIQHLTYDSVTERPFNQTSDQLKVVSDRSQKS